MKPQPIIVCAALRSTYSGRVICGPRHFDERMRHFTTGEDGRVSIEWRQAIQGFVDQFGQFYERDKAYEIASKNGQIRRPDAGTPGTLYSENLY